MMSSTNNSEWSIIKIGNFDYPFFCYSLIRTEPLFLLVWKSYQLRELRSSPTSRVGLGIINSNQVFFLLVNQEVGFDRKWSECESWTAYIARVCRGPLMATLKHSRHWGACGSLIDKYLISDKHEDRVDKTNEKSRDRHCFITNR